MKLTSFSSPKSLRWLLLINLVVIVIAASLPTTAYADDCLEDPLNAADCMRTGGYRQVLVVTFASLPTISVIIPNLLQAPVNQLPQVLQSQFGPAVSPPAQPPETLPPTPQPTGPPTNDKGQVWYQPPWDQGGEYWVDREEYDSIQQHLKEGYVWSDRWGWKQPGEAQQLDRDREQRWKKFTSKEEGQRRHEQLKRDIQRDLANDPEYQRIQRELDQIQQRLDDIKRQSLREDIAYYQRQAQYYNQRAEYYDTLSNAAGVVKTTADVAIDILGTAPGPGRVIKYGYHTLAKTGEVTAETGSISKGLAAGALEGGKSYLGDKTSNKVVNYTAEFLVSTAQKGIEKESLTEGLKEGFKSVGKKGLGDFLNSKIKIPGLDELDLPSLTHEQIMKNEGIQQILMDKFSRELGVKLSVSEFEKVLTQVMSK